MRWRIIPLDVALGSGVCIDHPTGVPPQHRRDESNPINVGCIRNYYSPGPPSVDEKERAGPRSMHHREQIPFSSLYFHGSEGRGRREREEREREEDRDRAVLPDLHVAAVSPLNCRSINIRWLNPRTLVPSSFLSPFVPLSPTFYLVLSLRLPLTSSSLVQPKKKHEKVVQNGP